MAVDDDPTEPTPPDPKETELAEIRQAVLAAFTAKGLKPRDNADVQYWIDIIVATGGFKDAGNKSYWLKRMAQKKGGVGDYGTGKGDATGSVHSTDGSGKSAIQHNLAADIATAYNRPISVSVINKLGNFQFLQKLGFDGQLGTASKTFHGLSDHNFQMTLFSSSMSPMSLAAVAWQAIKNLVPTNPMLIKDLIESEALGKVGPSFDQLVGFDQAFAISPGELKAKGVEAITEKL